MKNVGSVSLHTQFAALPYFASFFPTLLVISGNLMGGWYAAGNAFFALVMLVLADWLLPSDRAKPSQVPSRLPDLILFLTVLAHTVCIFTLLYGVYNHILTGKFIWLAAASTGIHSGVLGITAAHELVHRKEKFMQHLGIWNLFLTGYTHFFIEHRLGHHFRIGTWDDPATARYNESYYRFLVRTVPGQWLSALEIEAKRLRKKGLQPYTWHNFVVRAGLWQAGWIVALGWLLGAQAVGAYLVQAMAAILLLEFVNYIEHYGLVRSKGEKVSIHHSWQSDKISSRFTLFELSRHADHHLKAYKPFHTLESHPEGIMLPSGYYGMFYLCLVPPLWFRLINPIIDRHRSVGANEANIV